MFEIEQFYLIVNFYCIDIKFFMKLADELKHHN